MKAPKVKLEIDNDFIVLRDTLAAKELSVNEAQRNVYRTRRDGTVVWQVAPRPNGAGPFTNVYFDNGVLKAYAWDGGEYTLDVATGAITSSELMR